MTTTLERLRVNAGLSTDQLGEAAGISGMTVRRIEGQKVRPYAITLKAIADALAAALDVEVEAADLLEPTDTRAA